MKCLKCGAKMVVAWTRNTKTGEVKRRRDCPKCGKRRPTIER